MAEVSYAIEFSTGERHAWRRPRPIPASEWAEKYRRLTMSALPGPWRNEVTPYLAGIMDASFFPSVQTIIVCKSPQVGCTEAVLNCVGYAVDRQPGPVLMVYPDEKTARENSQDRIQPMFSASPHLKSLLTGYEDDKSVGRVRLKSTVIYTAWASSAARLANKPIRYAIEDEVDKYPVSAGKREASPEALAEARTITYRYNRKIWKISTPTVESGPIWRALNGEAQVIFDFWAQCPKCRRFQLMALERVEWPKDKDTGHSVDPTIIEADSLARYRCENEKCNRKWDDNLRDQAVRGGQWRSRDNGLELNEYLNNHRPRKIGFHLPAMISPFVSMSEVAAAFLRSRKSLDDFKNFKNKYEAVPWKQVVVSADAELILSARCDSPPQKVPPEGRVLMAGIDVQQSGFWFAVRAFASDFTSWLIHYGFLGTWEDVENLLFETAYPVVDSDASLRIFRACIDTGGGAKYAGMSMTEETYLWIRENMGRGVRIWGTKGASRALASKIQVGKPLDKTPSGKSIPGGLRLISVDTDQMKDLYHYRLNKAIEGLPQGAYLHAGTGPDYAAQILAEEKQIDDKGAEIWVQLRPDNHLLDCECLAMLCADQEFPGGGVNLLRPAPPPPGAPATAPPHRRIISPGVE